MTQQNATIVGFQPEVAEKANAEKEAIKRARQRKQSGKRQARHVKFVEDASLGNNPFASALEGVKVDG